MPKVRPLTQEARNKEAFRRMLDVKRAENGYRTWTALADAIGMEPGTLRSWKDNPSCISWEKLVRIFHFLKYTQEEVYTSLGFKP